MKKENNRHPAGYRKPAPTEEEILHDIMTRPTVPLIPHVAWAYRLSRTATYSASGRGEIETIDFGRSKRAITAPLRKKLGLTAAHGGDHV
jgi:hypothetical protein